MNEKLREALSLALQYVPAESKDLLEQEEIDKIHLLIKEGTEAIPIEPPVKPEIAEDYSFAILILDDMRLKYFKHKDELENAKDVLLKNAKRLMYFKKDKNGYWIKPDTYEW